MSPNAQAKSKPRASDTAGSAAWTLGQDNSFTSLQPVSNSSDKPVCNLATKKKDNKYKLIQQMPLQPLKTQGQMFATLQSNTHPITGLTVSSCLQVCFIMSFKLTPHLSLHHWSITNPGNQMTRRIVEYIIVV